VLSKKEERKGEKLVDGNTTTNVKYLVQKGDSAFTIASQVQKLKEHFVFYLLQTHQRILYLTVKKKSMFYCVREGIIKLHGKTN
jgi:hypothetical protein